MLRIMETLILELPDELRAFVEARVAGGGYASASEYVGALLEAEQRRLALRAASLDGGMRQRAQRRRSHNGCFDRWGHRATLLAVMLWFRQGQDSRTDPVV